MTEGMRGCVHCGARFDAECMCPPVTTERAMTDDAIEKAMERAIERVAVLTGARRLLIADPLRDFAREVRMSFDDAIEKAVEEAEDNIVSRGGEEWNGSADRMWLREFLRDFAREVEHVAWLEASGHLENDEANRHVGSDAVTLALGARVLRTEAARRFGKGPAEPESAERTRP